MSSDENSLNQIKEIGERMQTSISNYFLRENFYTKVHLTTLMAVYN